MRYNVKSMAYVLPILIFAPVYNIPRFFEFESNNSGWPNRTTSLTCETENGEKLPEELQLLVQYVHRTSDPNSILKNFGIQCVQSVSYQDSIEITETRKDKLYISVSTFN